MRFLTISFYSGIVLLILCILVLVSPLRDRFSNATQKIQGFRLNRRLINRKASRRPPSIPTRANFRISIAAL